jgi:spermidine/putrescine transport system permease protein
VTAKGAATDIRTSKWVNRSLGGVAVVVFVFFYAPLVVLTIFSFNDSDLVNRWNGFTLRWYQALPSDANLMNAVKNSLIIAFVSTAIATVLGTAAALALERYRRWLGKRTFDGLLYLPVIIPDVTMAVMLLIFFVQIFKLPVVSSLPGLGSLGIGTIVLSHIAFNISFVAIVVRARVSSLDPALEEAAADLYASRWQAFRRVTLPLILPGVLGGALLALTLSLDDVVITSFVQGPGSTPLAVEVFGRVKTGVTPIINAISTVMLVASMALVLVSLGFQRRGTTDSNMGVLGE